MHFSTEELALNIGAATTSLPMINELIVADLTNDSSFGADAILSLEGHAATATSGPHPKCFCISEASATSRPTISSDMA